MSNEKTVTIKQSEYEELFKIAHIAKDLNLAIERSGIAQKDADIYLLSEMLSSSVERYDKIKEQDN